MSETNEPIQVRISDGRYYASINGVARGSVTTYFDRAGNVVGHTIREGRMVDALIAKLMSEIERRGLEFPEEVQS